MKARYLRAALVGATSGFVLGSLVAGAIWLYVVEQAVAP